MRKGKFPPQATFYRGHFAPTWCFVIVPFLSSEFVFLLSFGEKSPTFPPQWKFEQLVKHELSPDSFSTRGTRKSYLIKIEFSTLIPSPLSSKKKNSRHAPRLAKIYRNYPIYFFSSHVERNETRKILSFQELLNSRIRKLGECQCQIYHWIKLYIYMKEGGEAHLPLETNWSFHPLFKFRADGIGISMHFALSSSFPPTEFLRFAGFNYIDSLSYRVSLAKRVACKARPLSAL